MKKYLWFTDLHLNRIAPWTFYKFIRNIKKENPDGIFLTGDISNGWFIIFHLRLIAAWIKCPIYFCQGNHDVYHSSFDKINDKIKKLCKETPNLFWVTQEDIIAINNEVCLIGHEGWCDGGYGDKNTLHYSLDWRFIKDFKGLTREQVVLKYQELAAISVDDVRQKLQKALDLGYKDIYILTHFPPFKEATRHEASVFKNFWLAYDVNAGMGKMIEEVAKLHKNRMITVLCGHSHTPMFIRAARNIHCQVGEANIFGPIHSQKIYL